MKTPVIQNNPDDPMDDPVMAPTGIGPRPSDGVVAWLQVWPVRHRRQAISGVVALVVALLAVGSVVATRKPTVTMGPATPPINSGDSPDFAAIDRYVQAEMATQRIPGLAFGIVECDQIVHLRGFGTADQSGRPVMPQTPFFAGSTTKSFTALAVMQLHEAGKVDLDAPVQRYLPWWRVADADASATITVRQLLYQVSGLSRATGNKHATSGDSSDSALEDQVRDLQSDTLTEPVGATWQYSNANYNTLGMIVQTVSNQPYEAYVQQHILDPLEMRNSVMSVTEAKKRGLVTGHRYWFGFPRPVDLPFNRGNLPAGGQRRRGTHSSGELGLSDAGLGAEAVDELPESAEAGFVVVGGLRLGGGWLGQVAPFDAASHRRRSRRSPTDRRGSGASRRSRPALGALGRKRSGLEP